MFNISTSNIALQFAAWMFTYAFHSTIMIVLLWFLFKKRPAMSIYLKEVLLKTVLIVGLCTASVQLCGNWGWGMATVVQPHQAQTYLPQDLAQKETNQMVSPATRTNKTAPMTNTGFVIHWYEALALGWLVIVLFLSVHFFWRKHQFLRSLIFVSSPQPGLDYLLTNLCHKFKLVQAVKLRFISNALSPLVLNKSTIIVPIKALEALNPDEQESMLAHELAHLKRRDDVWLKFYQALQVLLFFQPLNCWVLRQIHEITEQICDAKAAQITQNNQAMAKCLVEVASWLTSQPRWVVSMASRQKPLTTRIIQLLNNQTMKDSTKSRLLAPLPIVGMVALVGLIAILTLPGIHFSWAQIVKKNTQPKSFKAYTLNVTEESEGQYRQAIVIKNPQGEISEFYVDDKKYTAQNLGKFSFIKQALENYEVRVQRKRLLGEKFKALRVEVKKRELIFAKAYKEASKIKDEKEKKRRMKEIEREAKKIKEEYMRKKKQLEKDLLKKMKKK